MSDTSSQFDIIIVGAGISGIDAAYRIQTQTPYLTYTILEGRGELGGTWSLFTYCGVRSDSDTYTFSFPFRPWTGPEVMASGSSFLKYMSETVEVFGIDKHIQYRHRLIMADWSSEAKRWTLIVDHVDEANAVVATKRFTCSFFFSATGYYNYQQSLSVDIPDLDKFHGEIVHPQFWPKDFDCESKDVVIIGSGSTAITLLPSLAETAKHVTMLQRSPTYILSVSQHHPAYHEYLKMIMPQRWAFTILRWQAIIFAFLFVQFCLYFPMTSKRILEKQSVRQLPRGTPHDPHFKPTYLPWSQRMCLTPNGDFYKALRQRKGSVVTGNIEAVTTNGILLESGREIHADIIVTATGLNMQLLGGAQIYLDGKPVDLTSKFVWNGIMLQDVPNAFMAIGYTSASYTLSADISARTMTRLINDLKTMGLMVVSPRISPDEHLEVREIYDLQSTYIKRAAGSLPKAGDKAPWLPPSNYINDWWRAKFGDIHNGLEFS